MSQTNSTSLKHLYALLSVSNADLEATLKPKISQHDLVAAKLINSNNNLEPTIAITSIQNSRHIFKLDIQSKIYTSKGNWLWVKQFELHSADLNILTLTTNPRVIDIPYHGNNICAFWFFKNFYKELSEFIEINL